MAKLNFLNNYKVLYIYHPDEPISENRLRKNAGEKTFKKILSKFKTNK